MRRSLRMPARVSKRAVRNQLAFMGGETAMEQSVVKRGPQAENNTHKEVARWRNHQPGLLLERNKRRLATPPGMAQPIMLGWLCDGSPDWIGYQSLTITPDMVGRKVAVFVGVESKRRSGGATSDAQQGFLDTARDAGAIVGVARSYEDCGEIVKRWWLRGGGG